MDDNIKWLDLMPIRRAGQMTTAVRAISPVQDDHDKSKVVRARAKAWLVYLYALAKLDSWEWDSSWHPKKDKEAEDMLKEAKALSRKTKSDKDDYDVLWAEGLFLYYKGLFAESRKVFLDAIEDKGDEPKLLAEVAESRIYIGEPRQAVDDLAEIEGQFPNKIPKWFYWIEAWARCNSGFLREDKNDVTAAKRDFEQARKLIDEKILDTRKPGKDFDYDVLLLKAAVCLKLADLHRDDPHASQEYRQASDRSYKEFKTTAKAMRGHKWKLSHELKRSKFDTSNAKARKQLEKWSEVVGRLLDDKERDSDD